MLKRNKRYHVDIINYLCMELREYFYAFFYCDKNINDIIKVNKSWTGGKIIQSLSNFSYLFV